MKGLDDRRAVDLALRRINAAIPHLDAAHRLLNGEPGVGGGVGCATTGKGRVSGPQQALAAFEAAMDAAQALTRWKRDNP